MARKLHADEIEIDAVLVRRLVDGQFPHWTAEPLVPLETSGTVNVLYRLGDDKLVRLPRLVEWSEGVEHEHAWVPRLAPFLPIAIPQLLGKGASAKGYPCSWSIFGWLEGANPSPGRLAKAEAVAGDLAALILALRRVDPAGAPRAYRGGPLSGWDKPFRRAAARLHDEMDVASAIAAWEDALAQPVWTDAPVWVHADLLPGNLLLSGDRLSGVLDFAASGIGDPACDLMPAWSLLPAEARDTFRATAGADNATWAKGRGWALAQAAIALPYYRDTNPTMAATARHAIAEVLAD